MPSGALTLLEGLKYSKNVMKRGVVETIIQESPLLEMFPFIGFQGNAIEVNVEGTLPTPEFRRVNETYTRSWGADTKRFFGVSILGGEVFVDNFILKVAASPADTKARQWAKFSKAMALTFDKTAIDGTGLAEDFMGLNALIAEGLGQTYPTASTGLDLNAALGAGLEALDEAKDLLRSKSTPDALLLNRLNRRQITQAARNIAGQFSLIDMGTSVLGKQVSMYDSVPMRIIGDDRTGTAILGNDETYQSAGSSTSSMYFIAFGAEENVSGISGAGGSLDVHDFGETEAAPGHLGRVEWYPGIAVYDPFSLVRIPGVLP